VGITPSNQDALIGRVIGGRYQVLRLIGKGGMGCIYEVRNTRLGRSFAMKTLGTDAAANEKTLQRFRREADVIARIKHPHIVEIVDWEALDDGAPAIVMEYLRGEDLAARIAAGPLPWPLLARIADQMLAALSVAHANGIVHRDLKPQNVFLAVDDAGDERVKLLDFGVSKVRDSQSVVTTDERLLGTPAYMSPEQADARPDDIGPHSDVWAVGVLLHEMATGQVPFDAPSVPSILYKICHGSPASLIAGRPDAPQAFVDLVAATFVRDIPGRIPDATALRVRLREALHEVAGVTCVDELPAPAALRPSPSERTLESGSVNVTTPSLNATTPTLAKRKRKLGPLAVVVGCVAVALVAAVTVIATRERPAKPSGAPASMAKAADPTSVAADAGAAVEAVVVPSAPSGELERAVAADVTTTAGQPPRTLIRRKPEPAAATTGSATEAPNVDPSVTPPVTTKKKPCAKDDVECLYGDGT
jgi:serine/threonine-protein kinase